MAVHADGEAVVAAARRRDRPGNGRLGEVRLEHGDLRDMFAAIGRTDDAFASAALLGRPAEAAVPELATLIARLLTPANPAATAP